MKVSDAILLSLIFWAAEGTDSERNFRLWYGRPQGVSPEARFLTAVKVHGSEPWPATAACISAPMVPAWFHQADLRTRLIISSCHRRDAHSGYG